MEKRYEKNIPSISEEEQLLLRQKSVAIIGCGGLGGYLCEYAARIGFKSITVCDGDTFDESNLNRQLLSDTDHLGCYKAFSAGNHILRIDPVLPVKCFPENLTGDNYKEILDGCDLVFDGLDSVKARLLLEDKCSELNLPLIHGAINGWIFQVSAVMPGSDSLHKLYRGKQGLTAKSNLGFAAGACAGCQMAEAVKVLTGKPSLDGKLLIVDLHDFDAVTLNI